MAFDWFTSDTHFGHNAILKHDGRPFPTVEEMDNAIIARWNSLVGKRDRVWHIGDFAYRNKLPVEDYISQLRGHIQIIWGNHDYDVARRHPGLFASTQDIGDTKIDGQSLIMCHYSMRAWRGKARGAWHLFGHSHGRLEKMEQSLDVGTMCWDYRPLSFDQVRTILK